VKPEDYVYDSSPNRDFSQCTLYLSAVDEDFMIFGIPAYQQYYTIHDNGDNKLGIVPHSYSSKTRLNTSDPFAVGTIRKGAVGGPPDWIAAIICALILGGSIYFFGWQFIEYVEGWFPNSKWIQYELYTAYWFLVLCLCLLIRWFFTLD